MHSRLSLGAQRCGATTGSQRKALRAPKYLPRNKGLYSLSLVVRNGVVTG